MNIFEFVAEHLDNIVDEVHDAIGGKDVEGCNASLGNGGLDLEIPGPAHSDLLAPSGLHLGVALRHVAGHQGGARHHVAEEDGGEGLLVRQQAVQGGLGDLGEGLVGRREHCEGSFASKGLHKACRLHSCQESGEVRGGDGKLRNVLGRGCCAVACWGCSRCGEASQGDQGGGRQHCEKVGSFFFLLPVAVVRQVKATKEVEDSIVRRSAPFSFCCQLLSLLTTQTLLCPESMLTCSPPPSPA